jgi:N-acetyl-gamma-glutamyl-phosphate reductase
MINIAVVGASGYAGGELLRLIADHPELNLQYATGNSQVGKPIANVFPNLPATGAKFQDFNDIDWKVVDLAFFALPHGESSKLIIDVPTQVKIIDLGADYRLRDGSEWEKFYRSNHAGSWVYGLADLPIKRAEIATANRVANPGCYATAISLSAAPFKNAGLVSNTPITVVAASGTSGAGRKADLSLLSAENMNNLSAYKIGGIHQHIPEIEQLLTELAGEKSILSFNPMLAPMPRGILAITQLDLKQQNSTQQLREVFKAYYESSPFVVLLAEGMQPQTKAVQASNFAHFQVQYDDRTNRVVITAAIDNLIKGAAGQAIQNLNLMLGFPINTGLTAVGIFP